MMRLNRFETTSKKTPKAALVFILLGLLCEETFSTCTVPSALQGSWYRASDDRVIQFTASDVQNHELKDLANNALTSFTCELSSGDSFVWGDLNNRNEYPEESSKFFYAYFCWKLTKISDTTYWLYQLTTKLPSGDLSFPNQRVFKRNTTDPEPSVSNVCSLAASTQAPTVLYKVSSPSETDLDIATISSASQKCPDDVLATYSYVKDTSGCQGVPSKLTFCDDDTTPMVNYTVCSTPKILYSKDGTLSCMATFTLPSEEYVVLVNHDATSDVDSINYFRFSCMKYAVTTSGSTTTVSATVYPRDCTATTSQSLVLTLTDKCSTTVQATSGTNIVPIIAGVVAGVVIITLVVVIIILVIKMRARRKARSVTPSEPNKAQNGTVPEKSDKLTDGPSARASTPPPLEERKPQASRLPPLEGVAMHSEPLRS